MPGAASAVLQMLLSVPRTKRCRSLSWRTGAGVSVVAPVGSFAQLLQPV